MELTIEKDQTILTVESKDIPCWTRDLEIQSLIKEKQIKGVYVVKSLKPLSKLQKEKMLTYCQQVEKPDQYLTFIDCDYCGDWDVASYMYISDYTRVTLFYPGPFTQMSTLCHQCS